MGASAWRQRGASPLVRVRDSALDVRAVKGRRWQISEADWASGSGREPFPSQGVASSDSGVVQAKQRLWDPVTVAVASLRDVDCWFRLLSWRGRR